MRHDLTDTDENDAITDDGITPGILAEKSHVPATQLYVEEMVRTGNKRHKDACFARRLVRRWTLVIAAMFGALAVIQVVIALYGKAIIRETVHDAIHEEIGKIVNSDKNEVPNTLTGKYHLQWPPFAQVRDVTP